MSLTTTEKSGGTNNRKRRVCYYQQTLTRTRSDDSGAAGLCVDDSVAHTNLSLCCYVRHTRVKKRLQIAVVCIYFVVMTTRFLMNKTNFFCNNIFLYQPDSLNFGGGWHHVLSSSRWIAVSIHKESDHVDVLLLREIFTTTAFLFQTSSLIKVFCATGAYRIDMKDRIQQS